MMASKSHQINIHDYASLQINIHDYASLLVAIYLWDDSHPMGCLAIPSQFASSAHEIFVALGMMQLRDTPGLWRAAELEAIRLANILSDGKERPCQEVLSR